MLVTVGALAVALTLGATLLVQLVTAQRIQALDDSVLSRVLTVHDLLITDRIPESLGVAAPEVVQILDADGEVLATSGNASATLPVVGGDVLAQTRQAASEPIVRTVDSPYAGQARVAMLAVPAADLPPQWLAAAADGVVIAAGIPLADVTQTQRTLTLLLMLLFPVLALGLALVVWLVLGRALRPVEDLRAAADDVAASGGPGSLPVPRTGELAALARTLNAMLDRLDVSAQRQRAFVADAAHELRSPLASLSAALEVAQRHPDSYPQPELLADLEADVARLQVLVEDLLVLAKVGSRPLRVRVLDLRAVTDGVVGALTPARDGVQVSVSGMGQADGDPDAVSRVLRNLLANAVRHARSTVRIAVENGMVRVEDDGAGIDPAQRERVFERFVRLDEARERDAGGTGLGLAIARELAREQGGDVTLGDATPGTTTPGTADSSGLRAVLTLPSH